MKILFADKFPEHHLNKLRSLEHSCVYRPELTAEDLSASLPGVEALVVRSTRVDGAAIGAADRLRLIIRAGAGTNTIDNAAASSAGVRVCNVPGRNALAVAELTMGLLLAIDRNIPDNVADLRAGRWNKQKYSVAQGLHGRAMGIVGLGAIGLAVAERAVAFGIRVQVIGKPDRPEETLQRLAEIGATQVADLAEMAERCDILSFHVPACAATRGMVDAALLDRLPSGAIVLNTARGDLIDERALIDAMDRKGIRAGLDVYLDEPASGEAEFHPTLVRHPNVYGTHHIGASTTQAQNAVADGVLEIVDAFEQGQLMHCVNAECR